MLGGRFGPGSVLLVQALHQGSFFVRGWHMASTQATKQRVELGQAKPRFCLGSFFATIAIVERLQRPRSITLHRRFLCAEVFRPHRGPSQLESLSAQRVHNQRLNFRRWIEQELQPLPSEPIRPNLKESWSYIGPAVVAIKTRPLTRVADSTP